MNKKVLITTIPFGEVDPLPLMMLEEENLDYVINPLGKKPNEDELANILQDFEIVIAGTEKYTDYVLDSAKKLKFISRVGVGLDGINFKSLRKRDIKVSYTPDAPTPAVAELTIASIFSLLRHLHTSNLDMHQGKWKKIPGKSLTNSIVGIIGLGPIGQEVLKIISNFGCEKILLNDINENADIKLNTNIKWETKENIYKYADIITIHVPLNINTNNMIDKIVLQQMKSDVILINTARGGIINENDLLEALNNGHLGGVSLDVFESEPYSGKLIEINRCLLTPHIGTMTSDCRSLMELQAVEEAIRFCQGKSLEREVYA